MSFNRRLTRAGHVHRFAVVHGREGWDVREEEDHVVLQRARRKDWHRVERNIWLFTMTALALEREGWIEN